MTLRAPWVFRRDLGPRVLPVALSLALLPAMAEEPDSAAHGHHEPHSVIGVFIGDTTEDRRDGLTLGLEYEYRATENLGVGFTVEHVSGDFDTNVFVLPVALHNGAWKVYAGPGVESGEEGDEPLFRVGVEYGLHAGEYEISPQLDVDFVDGEQLIVFGVVFAREF
jgi:hypothetical protein